MGEIIKKVGAITIGSKTFDVELNKATYVGGPRYIHIQNPKFRYCLTEADFYQFASEILKSRKHLMWNKSNRKYGK